jgi:putative ABC transport system ATP-binding protein
MRAGNQPSGVLRVVELTKTYGSGEDAVSACVDISLSVRPGELLMVQGPAGSGKTTLLNCIGGLAEPDSGSVFVDGVELTAMRESDRAALRQTHLGFVFQSSGLIPILTVAENVEVPMRIVGIPRDERQTRVDELLELVGLSKHGDRRATELSVDQQQRVGLARALADRPKVLIADEPTRELDGVAAGTLMDLIRDLVRSHQVAAVVSSRDRLPAGSGDHVIELRDGRICCSSTGATAPAPTPDRTPGMIQVPAEYAAKLRRKS